MRYFAVAVALAFAVSTMPLGPAWAQTRLPNPEGAPIGGGGSGGFVPKGVQVNSFGKCWVNTENTNYKWGDCPKEEKKKEAKSKKGGHAKKT